MTRKTAEVVAEEPESKLEAAPSQQHVGEVEALEAEFDSAQETASELQRQRTERESLLATAQAREADLKASHREAVRAQDGEARSRFSRELFDATQEAAAQGSLLEELKPSERAAHLRVNELAEALSRSRRRAERGRLEQEMEQLVTEYEEKAKQMADAWTRISEIGGQLQEMSDLIPVSNVVHQLRGRANDGLRLVIR